MGLSLLLRKDLYCSPGLFAVWRYALVDLRVEEEMADVLAAIQYAAERMGLDQKRIAARMEKKYALYCKWERDELEGGK